MRGVLQEEGLAFQGSVCGIIAVLGCILLVGPEPEQAQRCSIWIGVMPARSRIVSFGHARLYLGAILPLLSLALT